MRFLATTCLMLLLFARVSCALGQGAAVEQKAANGGQSEQMFQKQITKTVSLKYLLYLPKDYGQKEQKWPFMLFLHGAGERGDDLDLVKKHGPPKLVEQGKEFPFIIVSPQCPAGTWWTEEMDALMALLDDVQSKYAVDPNRVYLTGLSMGGYGSWALACRHPERFAAVAPICGGGERYLANKLKDVPVWAFHGAKDPVVPLRESQEMVDALKRAGGEVQLTVYPEAEHDCWTVTYDNPKLYEWFLSRYKNGPSK
jgi:predicted peptidase